MNQSCRFPACVALVAEGRDTCALHTPEQVIARATAIVRNNFGILLVRGVPLTHESLMKLHADILYDFEHTV